jgi:membrane protease YdiL (CAAX protease family)
MTTNTSTTVAQHSYSHFPTVWVAAIWIIAFFIAQIFFGAIAAFIAILSNESAAALTADASSADMMKVIALPTIWGLVISNLATCAALWAYLRREDRFAAIGFNRWSNISAGLTLGLAVLVIGGGLIINYGFSEYVFPDVEMQKEMKELFAAIPKTVPNNILLFLAVAVFAPLLEEFLFRGMLQNSLMPLMPPTSAILLSAAIFAGAHLDMMAFAPIFILGAAFGYLYHVTGSLRVCIIMHMINNGAALLLG